MSGYPKELDSLFRHYGSQISAHSNYLVALIFAWILLFYRLAERLDFVYIPVIIFFLILTAWFYGRLLYYIQITMLVQHYMGITRHGTTYSDTYQRLLRRRKDLVKVIVDSLFNKIQYSLLGEVDKAFEDLIRVSPIERWKVCLITIANSISLYGGYQQILKAYIKKKWHGCSSSVKRQLMHVSRCAKNPRKTILDALERFKSKRERE